jgi:two-component system response regulator HydG
MTPRIRVLVIDDRPHAEAIVESLGCDRYEVVIADWQEGLHWIEERDFDAIITELVPDGSYGLDVLYRARRRLPGVAVIIVTGKGSLKVAVAAMRAGALTFLTKPLDLGELRKAMARVGSGPP